MYIASFDGIHFLYTSSYDAKKTKDAFDWVKKESKRTLKADFTIDDAHDLAKHLANSFIGIVHLTGSSTTAKVQTGDTHCEATYAIDKLIDKTFTHVWHLHRRHTWIFHVPLKLLNAGDMSGPTGYQRLFQKGKTTDKWTPYLAQLKAHVQMYSKRAR